MKNFFIWVTILFLVIIALKIGSGPVNTPSKLPAPGPVAYSSLDLRDINHIDYSVHKISKSFMTWLTTKSDYKSFLDRKLVMYPTGTNCPYGRGIEKAVMRIRPLYEGKYNYYALNYSGGGMRLNATFDNLNDVEEYKKFIQYCTEFCVINPYNNQIFSIKGFGVYEIKMLDEIFKRLENW